MYMILCSYFLVCPKEETFTCSDGLCVLILDKCDGVVACSNDEKECPFRSVCTENANCAEGSKCMPCNLIGDKLNLQCGSKIIEEECKTDEECCTGFCEGARSNLASTKCQKRSKPKIIFSICIF